VVGVTHAWPWPAGAATGIGSLPGTDIDEALKLVLGELPDLPHLPELPARGPGAELIGRGAGLLVEFPVELYVGRWRTAARPGRDARNTRDLFERDLDGLTAHAFDYTGSFKVQATGPWTLAAGLELPAGGRLLRDPGAVRELTASLAEGVAGYVREVQARLPQAQVLLQLDEPSLPAVLAAQIPTESGLATLRSVSASTARDALASVISAAGAPVVVHCCAPRVPIGLLREAGAAAVSVNLDLVGVSDELGEALDGGMGLVAGALAALPPPDGRAPSSARVAQRVRELWQHLGFPAGGLAAQVVVAPACGLAGASPGYVRAALAACRDAARRLADEAA
jgi:methionine synthase II (cobalamin-independent)